MKKRSGSKIKVYRDWDDKKPLKATLGKKIKGDYDDSYMATIDGEDKEIKVAYGQLSKMEPPRDVWFMMNPSELNEVFEWWHPLVSLGGAIALFSLPILFNAPGQILNPGSIVSGDSWGDLFRHYKKKFKDKKAAKNLTNEDVLELIDLMQSNMEQSDTGSGVKRYMKGLMNKLEKEMSKDEEELDKDKLLRLYRDVQNYSERIKINQPSDTTPVNEVKIKNQIKEEIIRILSEEEMTDAEMEKKAEKEAKSKEAEKISDVKDDLAKQQKMLKKVKDVMKDRAKDYKKAEGKEKDNIKTELKSLTSAKKKIEAKIKKLEDKL
jgi:hypothetical protein